MASAGRYVGATRGCIAVGRAGAPVCQASRPPASRPAAKEADARLMARNPCACVSTRAAPRGAPELKQAPLFAVVRGLIICSPAVAATAREHHTLAREAHRLLKL